VTIPILYPLWRSCRTFRAKPLFCREFLISPQVTLRSRLLSPIRGTTFVYANLQCIFLHWVAAHQTTADKRPRVLMLPATATALTRCRILSKNPPPPAAKFLLSKTPSTLRHPRRTPTAGFSTTLKPDSMHRRKSPSSGTEAIVFRTSFNFLAWLSGFPMEVQVTLRRNSACVCLRALDSCRRSSEKWQMEVALRCNLALVCALSKHLQRNMFGYFLPVGLQ